MTPVTSRESVLPSNRLRTLLWIAALLFAALPCRAQTTLREQLRSAGILADSFSKAELDEIVDGVKASNAQYVFFAYLRTEGDRLTGYPRLVRYDQTSGTILRSDLKFDEKDQCCGAPDGIQFLDNNLLLSFHYNPSASTLLVLDQNLQTVEIMYGFDVERVAPHQLIMTEGMMHFAPIHAERLQFVDLGTGATQELYPPMNDALRVAFNAKNKKLMPPDDICHSFENDYCDPAMYDEGVTTIGTDGNGRFALVAGWNSSHVTSKGGDPVDIASESVLYLYEQGKDGWLYCEQELSEGEANALTSNYKGGFEGVKARCHPNQKVVPDMTTSDLSPFPEPSRLVK